MTRLSRAATKPLGVRVFLFALLLSSFANLSYSSDRVVDTDLNPWQLVRDGTAVVLMRHSLAPGIGDPSDFVVDRCETQRNLSDDGRKQAKNTGEALRKNGIATAMVLTSQWCRCIETADLLSKGKPVHYPTINSFFQDRSTAAAQTETLRKDIAAWIRSDSSEPRVLVTHQVNISALTGEYANSGDMLIVTLEGDELIVLDQIQTPLK